MSRDCRCRWRGSNTGRTSGLRGSPAVVCDLSTSHHMLPTGSQARAGQVSGTVGATLMAPLRRVRRWSAAHFKALIGLSHSPPYCSSFISVAYACKSAIPCFHLVPTAAEARPSPSTCSSMPMHRVEIPQPFAAPTAAATSHTSPSPSTISRRSQRRCRPWIVDRDLLGRHLSVHSKPRIAPSVGPNTG
jgi:hypothetical protein